MLRQKKDIKKDIKKEVGDSVHEKPEKERKTYYDVAIDWDISRTKIVEGSEKRAWAICIMLGLMLIISWGGLYYLLPLKKDVPYVIQVDNVTGRTEATEIYNPKNLTYSAIRDKYWINKYINIHEFYDYYLLSENYLMIQYFAEAPVIQDYLNVTRRGPASRIALYQDRIRVNVEVISIMLRPSSRGNTASVRFTITQHNLRAEGNPPIASKTFTVEIAYAYEDLELNEKGRLINPLGFRVKSYHLVSDAN